MFDKAVYKPFLQDFQDPIAYKKTVTEFAEKYTDVDLSRLMPMSCMYALLST